MQIHRKLHSALITATLVVGSPFASVAYAAKPASLTVTVATGSVTARGVSPGSTVFFMGVGRTLSPQTYMERVGRWALAIPDDDKDGVVTFTLPQSVPSVSVWVAVDLRDASYGVASGAGIDIRPMFLGNPLRKSNGVAIDRVAVNHGYLDLLYVKPGLGALKWTAMDGTPSDEDGANGVTVVSLARGKALGLNGEKPVNFTPGGVLIAIDPVSMEIGIVDVDEDAIRGAR